MGLRVVGAVLWRCHCAIWFGCMLELHGLRLCVSTAAHVVPLLTRSPAGLASWPGHSQCQPDVLDWL